MYMFFFMSSLLVLSLTLYYIKKTRMDFFMFILIGLLATSQVVVPQDDEATLLAVSRELSLAQWGFKNSGNYCSWPGIGCGLNNSRVERLDLSHQGLQGNVSVISQLTALKSLDLSYNNFHGLVPSEFGHLYELEFLDLSFNKFGSSVPKEWGRLRNLKSLNLSNNLLTGEIPVELEGLEQLHDLQLYVNKFVGFIPDWVGSLPKLRVFTAYENGFVGQIPKKLGSVSGLAVLNLHSNQLQGPIPKSIFVMGKLETLVLTQNRLTGDVPELIGKCKGLSSVRIGDNLLIGSIPKSVGNITGLTYFEADNNNLSGEIVPEFSQCANLTLLNLASNGLTGRIPRELGRLTNLQEFIVSGNSLFGEIPTAILRLKNLNKLDLSSNRINGTIPQDICISSRLQYLLLSQNSIRGEIPREIGNCTKLLELQLGNNYLSGNIPLEISHIKNLQIAMNLSFNHLRGQLPSELGKLDKLVLLDVSNNQLSGSIPALIRGMISLIEVNLSNNQFSGPIPPFVPFQKSSNSSFSGNKGLCGEPLNSPCSNSIGSDLRSYHHSVSYRIVLTVIGSGLAVFVSVSIVVLVFMIRERQEKAAKNAGISDHIIKDPLPILAGQVFVENLQQAIDFEAVVKATMKDENKLSSGTFSTVYKADMPSGMTLSVKRLKSVDRAIIQYQNKMIRELERLSRLIHDNLIRPIGYVIYEDVALLLHQYFRNGTLARYLHDSSKQLDYEPDWPTRLHIATGVAEGLAFLHHVAVIHLDISSGNVLLDSNSNALIGEVEISKLLDPSRGFASISAVAGSFGYIPPEYAYTMQVTAPGNVYSYGVIMLEILTTRLPVDEEFGEGMDLVKWVQSSAARGETPEQILDSRLGTVSFAWRREMLAALKIALLCTDITPARRPKMGKVVELLKEVTKN